jgi:hypothetical protein
MIDINMAKVNSNRNRTRPQGEKFLKSRSRKLVTYGKRKHQNKPKKKLSNRSNRLIS